MHPTAPPFCNLENLGRAARTAAHKCHDAPLRTVALLESDLAHLAQLAARLQLSDLGFEHPEPPPTKITYVPVAELPGLFTMAVFMMPDGSVLPLHDHPGMFVVSRVLWGTLEVEEFDLDDDGFVTRSPTVVAEAGSVRSLTPQKGNVHSFRARGHTAVFDLLVPPYDDNVGCRYYQIVGDPDAGDVQLEVS